MADSRSLLQRILYPAEAKSTASGVAFVGPAGTAELIYLNSRARSTIETLTTHLAYAVSAYCYTAMRWRAERMAQAPLMVVRETEDGQEWQPTHPLAPLLAQPRPDLQMGELLERTQMYRDLTSQALWVDDVDRLGRRAMVTPFSGAQFRTKPEGPLIYGQYEILNDRGGWNPVARERVVHFREVNPASWREGVSKVDVALVQLDLGHNVNRIVHAFLRKAVFPGGVISSDKDWRPTPEEFRIWKLQVEQWLDGPAGQGKPLITNGSTQVQLATGGMQGLLPEDILDRVEATVGAVFGVPPVVLGWLSGMKNSPWSQMSEARRQAYEDTIEPLWGDVSRRLTMAWLTPEEQAQGLLIVFDTSRVTALKSDLEQQARIGALAMDVLTVNERRVMLGQDPLPEDDARGEEIVGLRAAPAIPDNIGGGDPPVDDDEELPVDDEDELGKGAKAGSDTKDLLWLLFDVHTKASEPAWERMVYAHLQALRTKIVAAAGRTLRAEKAKPVDPTSGASFQLALNEILDQDRPRLAAKAYPLLVSTGGTAVRRLASRVNLTFSLLEPGLLKYAREESVFLARVMGKTTGEDVAAAVQAGLNAGETVRALTKRLEQLPAFDRDRAKMTARTETTRAWNGSQRRSMSEFERSSGKKVTKSWLSSRDGRVREEHEDLDDDRFIDIDQTFANGLQEPGEPNCRCTLIYGFADTRVEEGQP